MWVFTLVMGLLLVREGFAPRASPAGGRLAVVLAGPSSSQRLAQAEFLKRRYAGVLLECGAGDQARLLASLARRRDLAHPVFIEIADRGLGGPPLDTDLILSYYPDADIWTFDGTRPPEKVSDTLRRLLDPVATGRAVSW